LICFCSQAYTLVLDGVIKDEGNAIQLSKLLSTCFIVRGSQLSVLRRLPSQYIIQIQTNLLSWIAKRIAAYENNKNKKSLKQAIGFFKVLVPLLGAIQSRDALKMWDIQHLLGTYVRLILLILISKAHMDQVLAEAKVEISPSSKLWEPQRVYEKRLGTIQSKENRKFAVAYLVPNIHCHVSPSTQDEEGEEKGC
jgi:cohesin complex subunit SA-1/2